jgi:predicted O-methyltransferase YrrM
MKLTVLTCTRDRHEAFALCEHHVRKQTRQPDQWLVLDDGNTPVKCTMGQQYVYCPDARQGVSMLNKLKIAFAPGIITGEIVVFVEDDDAYHSTWLETCERELSNPHVHLFGEGRAYYYNVRERWWFQHANMDHASLCATAIRKELFPLIKTLAMGRNPFIDTPLWARVSRHRRKMRDPQKEGKALVIGIKAMPGTLGYSGAHSVRDRAARDDLGLVKLTELIGTEVSLYEKFWKDYAPPPKLKVPIHTETGKAYATNWMRWLGHLTDRPGIVGMEIGTFKGDSAEFMAENVFTGEGAEYHCVDPFTGNPEHIKEGIDGGKVEKEARGRLSKFPQVKIHKTYSQDFLPHWTGRQFDFIFVDGEHTSQAVMRDCVMAFEHLKVGGIMLIDDYLWEVFPRPEDRPKLGIDGFLAAYIDFIELLPPTGWQVCLRRTK